MSRIFYYGKRLLNEPQLIKKVCHRGYDFLSWRLKRYYPHPKRFLYLPYRNFRRNKNTAVGSRILIFTIFEEQDALMAYKKIFLSTLSTFMTKTLIVVNGSLPDEDMSFLKKIGEVITRENSGYDTGAFRTGLLHLGRSNLNRYDELFLINDTLVGPISDFEECFKKMERKKNDFWGLTYGEVQKDFTGYNSYGYVPRHLQTFFLAIKKSLLSEESFWRYWENIPLTDTREKAIGYHETFFTEFFSRLGFRHDALMENNSNSGIYLHPLRMVKDGFPFIKYKAFGYYSNERIRWQGSQQETEIPLLMEYLAVSSDYPQVILKDILEGWKNKVYPSYILIIDGVEQAIPQLSRYRVENKIEQLKSLNFNVIHIDLSKLKVEYGEHASHIIIYRAPENSKLVQLCKLAQDDGKTVLYDIDDLVVDVKYTNQLAYVKKLSRYKKVLYDQGVESYNKMLLHCDGVITSTKGMKAELQQYQDIVLLNRNLAGTELVQRSQAVQSKKRENRIAMGYFSGSITHNENFQLIQSDIVKILKEFPQVDLHLVGYLDLPEELQRFDHQVKRHEFVSWEKLPALIAEVDINLAPLVNTVFNRAKSEIKWIEAGLVKVPTVASNIGAFKEMIQNEESGVLVDDGDWYEVLVQLIQNSNLRETIAKNAYEFILANCVTNNHDDEMIAFLRSSRK